MNQKITSLKTLVGKRKAFKKKHKSVVFTNGCFDIIHGGHVRYLQAAKKAGDVLIVGLNTDASVRRIKGKNRPVVHEKDRAEVLSAFECVDAVILFKEETPERIICALKPDILVKGSDWAAKDIVGSECVLANGGKIKRIRLVKGRSTTNLIQKIVRTYG